MYSDMGPPFFKKEMLEPNRVGNNTKKIMVIRGSVTFLLLHDSGILNIYDYGVSS